MALASIALKHPILVDGQPVTTLTISREPNFGDMIEIGDIENWREIAAIMTSRLCGVPLGVVHTIHHTDVDVVLSAMLPFIGCGPDT